MKILALHGFLGTGQDFSSLKADLAKKNILCEWKAPDLFTRQSDWPLASFKDFAEFVNRKWQSYEGPKVLIGYSLGGRLALEVFKANPKIWSQVILLSTNLGLDHLHEKQERLAADLAWAEKFVIKPWAMVLEEWNRQGVFAGDILGPSRFESDFDRPKLAKAMQQFSLGHQDKAELSRISLEDRKKVKCFIGGLDKKYLAHYQSWVAEGLIENVEVISGGGHRLLSGSIIDLSDRLEAYLKL